MVKIAFCPTMEPYAEKIAQLAEIEIVPLQSAGQSMSKLRMGQVDGTLIGRYAKGYELDTDTKRAILKGGYTLVYKDKVGINESQLKQIIINTYFPQDEIQVFIPLFGEIHYFNSLNDCLQDNLETPVLINWRDYRDAFELLIPMNAYGKTPLFRAPVLYYKGIEAEIVSEIKNSMQ